MCSPISPQPRPRLTSRVAEHLASHLQNGDWAIDGTVGQGFDTLWLAKAVGACGQVWGIDLQATGIGQARVKLEAAGLGARVALCQGCHSQLGRLAPAHWQGLLAAAVFNLGYLPKSDHRVITQQSTTLPALETAWAWLRPGGWLSVVAYPGHPGGAQEAQCVEVWFRQHAPEARARIREAAAPDRPAAPVWHCLQKAARSSIAGQS